MTTTTIKLKRNNVPKEAGTYIASGRSKRLLVLRVEVGPTSFWTDRHGFAVPDPSMLWSDRITVEVEP